MAIAPASGMAATVDTTVGYQAAVGETNNLTVTDLGTDLRYDDASAAVTTTDPSCVPITPNAVRCPKGPIMILLGDLNDQTSFVGPVDVDVDQYGGTGNDILRGSAAMTQNNIDGGPGGPGDADTIIGGASSHDQVLYSARTNAVHVSLDGVADDGEAGEGDNVSSQVEDIQTGSGNDTVIGSAADNDIYTDAGNDSIIGLAGDDSLDASDGADTIDGGAGNDALYAGDTIAGASDGADAINGGTGVDSVQVYAPNATFSAGLPVSVTLDDLANDGIAGEGDNYHSDIEDVSTTAGGSDTVTGTAAINVLSTDAGNDSITGGPGDDILTSRAGNDTLYARDGYADRVDCGPGTDIVFADTLDTISPNCETVQVIDVGNANDTPEDAPPTVAFVSPADNALLPGGPSTVTVNAADDHGIARVVFIDDGVVVGTDTTAPYSLTYNPHGSDVGRNTLIAQAVDGANQTSIAIRAFRVARFASPGLTAKVAPTRDRTRPYRFAISGTLKMPAGVSQAEGCAAGTVTIQVKRGGATISTRRVALTKTCGYARSVTFTNRSLVGRRGRLQVMARFEGNSVLNPRNAPVRNVRAG